MIFIWMTLLIGLQKNGLTENPKVSKQIPKKKNEENISIFDAIFFFNFFE